MLKGKRVNVRTVRRKDLDTYHDLMADVEARGPFFPLIIQTEPSIQQRFEKDGMWGSDNGTMLIAEKESDRILGFIVWFKPCHYYDAVELGYILFDPADRGKGYTAEALMLFADFLFASKPIFRIQLQIEPANTPSIRVAEKCGFTLEGIARQAFIRHGQGRDIGVYSLVRSEYDRFKAECR